MLPSAIRTKTTTTFFAACRRHFRMSEEVFHADS